MFQGIYKSAIKMPDTNTNYIFGTGSIPIQIKTAQLATFADGTTKQQGYQVAEVNKLISTMLTGWSSNGNKPKSMSDNYLELILSCDNGFVVKKRLQFPHIIAWQNDSTPYNIADIYKQFSIDNWLKADDFENPDITLVVEPTDEILTTSTATPPEATTEQSGRFCLYYRNLPVGINRIHIDFHIKTKTEPIDFDLEVIDGLSWKDAQTILASNAQAKLNVLLSSVKDVYKFTGAEGNFENITMFEWSALYQQIISLKPNNKFTHDLYFYIYDESELNTKLTDLESYVNERLDSSGGFEENVPLTIIDGISVRATNGTENNNPAYCASDFLEVRGNYIRFSNQQIVAATTTIGLAFYTDKDLSSFISGHKWGVGAAQASLFEDTTEIPSGAKYARISAYKENKSALWLVMGQTGEHNYGLEERVEILEEDAYKESIHNDVEHIYEFPCSPATMRVVGNGTITSRKIGVWDDIYRQTLGCVECHLVGNSENVNNSIQEITTTSVDLEHKVILGSFALEKDYDVTHLTGVKFSLIDRANKKATIAILANYENVSDKVRFLRGGWFHFATTTDSIALDNPTFDINKVVGWEILVICNDAIDVYVNNIAVVNAMHKGGVCIIVDNMNPNVPAMCDYAYSKGIKMSCSIVPGWIGSNIPGREHATEEEIAQCAKEGHFIFNHTWTHNTGDNMTFDEQADDVFKAESWMIDKGYKEGCKAVSCPSAAFNNLKYEAYFATNLNLLYHHWTSAIDHPIHIPYYPMTKLLNITYLDVIPSGGTSMDTVDNWLKYVQRAIACGGIAVIGMHGTFWNKDTSYPNGEAFKHFIDQLALIEDLRVYTIGDILDKRYF